MTTICYLFPFFYSYFRTYGLSMIADAILFGSYGMMRSYDEVRWWNEINGDGFCTSSSALFIYSSRKIQPRNNSAFYNCGFQLVSNGFILTIY